MPLLHEDLTSNTLAACFEVSNKLGAGFLESVYEKALLIALREKGLLASSQVPIQVSFRGHNLWTILRGLKITLPETYKILGIQGY
jgi:GxxExxY protein